MDKLSGNGVKNISFQLHKSEILGFAGLVGAGRTELMHLLYGAAGVESGTVSINGEIAPAVRSLIVRCYEAGVDVRLGVTVTPELVKELVPDAVIVATGSVPLILPIPGLADCGYINAEDMLTGKQNVGKKVLIVGGGMVGAEAAEHLVERGHLCDIVEMKPVVGEDIMPEPRKYIMASLEEHKVGQFTNAKVSQFFADGVEYTSTVDGSVGQLRGYDNVVLAMGYRSNNSLSAELEKFVPQVIVIG